MLEIRHKSSTRTAYNDIYSDDGLLQRDSFYMWIIAQLNPLPGRSLLDISCGQGRLVSLAQSSGFKAFGLDFAVSGVRQGFKESPQSGWIVGDGETLPLEDNSIDYITHIGSLEHYLNPLAGAKEIRRTLKQNGSACILVPNAYGLFGNIRHVWRFGEIFDDGQPLQRYATRQTWEAMLKEAGLNIIKIIGYGEVEPPRDLQDVIWYIRHPRKIIRFILTRFVPLNLCNHFVFICTRGQTTKAEPIP